MRLFGPEVQELLELKLVKHHASQEEALPRPPSRMAISTVIEMYSLRPNFECLLELLRRILGNTTMDLDGVQKKTKLNTIDPDRPDFGDISVVV
jgi:hypothetical protein